MSLALIVTGLTTPVDDVASVSRTWSATTTTSRVSAYATFYGWYDNTPPGCATAYAGCAGGVGTYRDPITFASDRREFAVGTILYSPTWRKYFVMADDCQECDLDWRTHGPDGGPGLRHVDIWIGGRGAREAAVMNCEDALTSTTPSGAPVVSAFIMNPSAHLPVELRPFFDVATNRCLSGATTVASYGELVSRASTTCLSASPNGEAVLGLCTHVAGTRVTFSGATLRLGTRCLTTSGVIGSPVSFAPCSGGPDQEWSMTASGAVSWVQYVRCARVRGARVVLGACNNALSTRWRLRTGG